VEVPTLLEGFEHSLASEQIEVAEGFGDGLCEAAWGEAGELAASDAEGRVGLLFEEPADALRSSLVMRLEAREQRLWLLDGLAVAGENPAGGDGSDVGDGVDEGREGGPAFGFFEAIDSCWIVHAGRWDGGGEDGVAAEQLASLGDEGDEVAGGVAGGVDHLEGEAIGEVVAGGGR
jgi:hypothetical protein